MDFTPAKKAIIQAIYSNMGWGLAVTLILVTIKSPWFKGMVGEAFVKFVAWLKLPADTYHAIHNVAMPTANGSTQIDHIYVSIYGVFAVETKKMKG